jgi:hypothetical protein
MPQASSKATPLELHFIQRNRTILKRRLRSFCRNRLNEKARIHLEVAETVDRVSGMEMEMSKFACGINIPTVLSTTWT